MNPPVTIDWELATGRDVKRLAGELNRFICTSPEKPHLVAGRRDRSNHPTPWELDVQSYLRSDAIDEVRRGSPLLVGRVDGEAAAVSTWWPPDWLPNEEGVEEASIICKAVAVACRHRRQGGEVARLLMERTVAEMRVEVQRHPSRAAVFTVEARVHEFNGASQRLMSRHDFARGAAWGDDGLYQWFGEFPVT